MKILENVDRTPLKTLALFLYFSEEIVKHHSNLQTQLNFSWFDFFPLSQEEEEEQQQ